MFFYFLIYLKGLLKNAFLLNLIYSENTYFDKKH